MRLATSEYGSGFPLLVMHGLFGSRDNWHTIATRLSDLRRVITIDLPNHGESPHGDEFDYDVMVDAVVDTASALGTEGFDLLGHSMGGKAAMRLAERRPDLVSRLVVVDIAPVDYPEHSHANIIKAMRDTDLSRVSSRRDADAQMKAAVPNGAVRAFLLKNLVKSGDNYSWRLNIDAIESNYEALRGYPDDADVCETPALFVAGSRSDYIGSREREVIRRLFPRSEVQDMDGAGHWLHAERQDEFVDRVRRFLEDA
jgi:pimeloyl-ACP methyl ester carboxylesterase